MKRHSEPVLNAPIAAIVIFEIGALVTRAFLEVRLVDSGEPRPVAQDLSYLVVPPILIALMYPILRKDWSFLGALLCRHDLTIRVIVVSIVLGFSLRMSFWGGLISLVSFGVLTNPDPAAVVGPVISFECPDPPILVLSFLVASLLAPVTEEVINRGLILHSLLHRGRILAITLSSGLFAVMHEPETIIIALLFGFFLGVHVLNYRTLWAPLISHATYNGIGVLDWECVSGKWNPVETSPEIVAVGLVGTALAAVGMILSVVIVMRNGIGARVHSDAATV
jgi:membrane protease YdiL (CAAX protease family)